LSGRYLAQSTYMSTPSPGKKSSDLVHYLSKLGMNWSDTGLSLGGRLLLVF
jgi:hypothetical protein